MWRLDRRLPAKERRRLYRRDNRFELLLGILAFIAGVSFFAEPSISTPAREALKGPLDEVWEAMYLVGGLMVAVGVVRAKLLLEVPGLWLLAAALAVNSAALIAIRGPIPAAASLAPLIAAAWACLGRAWDLDRNVRQLARLKREGKLPQRRQTDVMALAPIVAIVLITGAVDYTPFVLAVLTTLLGGGLAGAAVAWARLRVERPGIVQEAATRTTQGIAAAFDRLERDNERLHDHVVELETELDRVRTNATAREHYLQIQCERQQDEIDTLQEHVGRLTAQLAARPSTD